MANTVDRAQVEITPDLDRFGKLLARRVAREVSRVGDEAGRTLGERISRGATRAHRGLSRIADAVAQIGRTGGLATLAGSLVAVTSAARPAVGVLLSAPAAGAAAAAAFGAVRLATVGMGDAFKAVAEGDAEKLEEALKGLSPAAREVVREVSEVKPAFDDVRRVIQERFFSDLAEEIRPLARTFLPLLETGLGAVAAQIGSLVDRAARVAREPFFRGAVAEVMEFTAQAAGILVGAVEPLMRIIARLVEIGGPMVLQLATWATQGIQAAGAFVQTARGGQLLRDAIADGVETMGQLLRIARNLGEALAAIFDAAQGAGVELLDIIEGLTESFAAWATSVEGQQALADVFALVRDVAADLVAILPLFTGALADLAGFINGMSPGVRSVVTQFLAWSILLGPLITRVVALLPVLFRMGNIIGVIIGRVTALIVRLGLLAARIVFVAVTTAVQVGVMIARWIALGTIALAQAARVALAWLISLGPIGIVIAAVVAAVALIIAKWDDIKRFTAAAWNFIKAKTAQAWNAVERLIIDPVRSAIRWVRDRFNDVVSFIRGLPGRIRSAAAGMWDGIVNAFKSAINVIIRGWNRIEFRVPRIDPPGPGPTFGPFVVGLPDIPLLQHGGILTTPGSVMVGEAGPELLNLPAGASVTPLDRAGTGGGPLLAIENFNAVGLSPADVANELSWAARKRGPLTVGSF